MTALPTATPSCLLSTLSTEKASLRPCVPALDSDKLQDAQLQSVIVGKRAGCKKQEATKPRSHKGYCQGTGEPLEARHRKCYQDSWARRVILWGVVESSLFVCMSVSVSPGRRASFCTVSQSVLSPQLLHSLGLLCLPFSPQLLTNL